MSLHSIYISIIFDFAKKVLMDEVKVKLSGFYLGFRYLHESILRPFGNPQRAVR